jgi:hypothetical protein
MFNTANVPSKSKITALIAGSFRLSFSQSGKTYLTKSRSFTPRQGFTPFALSSVREPSTTNPFLPPGIALIVFEYAVGVNDLEEGNKGPPKFRMEISMRICIQYPIRGTL